MWERAIAEYHELLADDGSLTAELFAFRGKGDGTMVRLSATLC
jgi:hypothetical protein